MATEGSKKIFQGILIGVVTTIIATGASRLLFREHAPELLATVEVGPVVYPPPIMEELRSLNEGIASDLAQVGARLDGVRDEVHQEILAAISGNAGEEDLDVAIKVADTFPSEQSLFKDLGWLRGRALDRDRLPWVSRAFVSDAPWLSGYWKIVVNNEGDEIARSVSLDVPSARYAMVAGSGGARTHMSVSETIELGNILPKQKSTVIAWTYSEPGEFDLGRIILRHEKGLGEIAIVREGHGFWTGPYVGQLVLLAIGLALLLVGSTEILRKIAYRNAPPT